MLEKALKGGIRYYLWLGFLLVLIGLGASQYMRQLDYGLGITGMSRDISWGFYIAQFTFMVGVAASAVMLVLPTYLHNYKVFGKIIILGEALAVAAVAMCIMFILVDLGQPMRVFNVMLHPTPNSILFWDMIVLNGYLFLNLGIGWVSQDAERNGVAPPSWIKPFIYLSIPWAFSIHTVTAFLYAGLPGRHLWLSAIMAPRFLASAFASGPALLILLAFLVRKVAKWDAGKEPIQTLGTIVTYGMLTNMFFFVLELFTAFYSNIPEHKESWIYLFAGLEGHNKLVPWAWTAVVLAFTGVGLLINPKWRKNELLLGIAAAAVFMSAWIDKGMLLVIGGFIPSPLGHVTEYDISGPEFLISLGVYATGALILTLFYKAAVTIKREVAGEHVHLGHN